MSVNLCTSSFIFTSKSKSDKPLKKGLYRQELLVKESPLTLQLSIMMKGRISLLTNREIMTYEIYAAGQEGWQILAERPTRTKCQ